MLNHNYLITRREFFKQGLLFSAGLTLKFDKKNILFNSNDVIPSDFYARNTVYSPNQLPIRLKPDKDAGIVRALADDEYIPWVKEVIGSGSLFSPSKTWVETPEGYIYRPSVQKVKNNPNEPVSEIPSFSTEQGMWVEVTVPYVNLELVNPSPNSPAFQELRPELWRLYYSQVIWVDGIRTNADGKIQYRINERYGSHGDVFWADAKAFRIISPDEIAPINQNAEKKRIVVNNNQQTLTCYEGDNEVYFCRVSTGLKFDLLTGLPKDDWVTPKGEHFIWRKSISTHMSGGGTGAGWDTMAIPWSTFFVGSGVAIHSTFWHNDFGSARSHGCVNASPEDSKWIFRWTAPVVAYNPGDITDNSFTSTKIDVIEPLY